jgi:hypothetical protein
MQRGCDGDATGMPARRRSPSPRLTARLHWHPFSPLCQAVPDPASTTVTDLDIMRVHIPPLEK